MGTRSGYRDGRIYNGAIPLMSPLHGELTDAPGDDFAELTPIREAGGQ